LKIDELEGVLSQVVWGIGYPLFERGERVHLALSGGVDSTLLLYKLLEHGLPVTAHTMAASEESLDLVHAHMAITAARGDVEHEVHLVRVSEDDVRRSNRLLEMKQDRPDNYLMLMRAISPYTRDLLCGDCIDEMAGGYYQHQESPTHEVFRGLMEELVPRHLTPLHLCSSFHNVRVYLPYADERVVALCQRFALAELVTTDGRKRPIYELARRAGVPRAILERRKRGLISALELSPL